MAAIVKGPFTIQWGGNPIVLVSEISTDFEQATEDVETVQGQTIQFDGAITASVELTLLGNDVAALAAVLPQYHVANGGVLSTGETVNYASGAIDVKAASCDESTVYNDLDIISCENPGEVFRLVNARSRISSVDYESTYRTVTIQFVGQPEPGDANIQFFREGTINVVS